MRHGSLVPQPAPDLIPLSKAFQELWQRRTHEEFLAIYIGTEDALKRTQWNELDKEKRAALEASGIQAWMEWGKANSAAIVDHGGPLGKTKRASAQGITDIKNSMAGYVIVQAESHEAAARLFENHPHFSIFPHDSVEIMSVCRFRGVTRRAR